MGSLFIYGAPKFEKKGAYREFARREPYRIEASLLVEAGGHSVPRALTEARVLHSYGYSITLTDTSVHQQERKEFL